MIEVYDQDMAMQAVLENADGVGYTLTHNDLWTATFRLPSRDPKNQYCQMHNLVRITDGPRDIGLYRIIGIPNDAITGMEGYTEYSCEHVAATLLDDVLFGYHEIGGYNMRTADVIRYILDQQEVKRWQLGSCDFSNRFEYKFENDSLLSALLSLGEVLTEPFTWDFDTSATPWTVSLRRADLDAGCGIYYKRNLREITRTVDASTLVTRLYLLGYGEGINQLTIKDINGGKPYLDADTIATYGVKKSVFCDRRFEKAESLKARGEQLLESLKIPYITYTAQAADLVQLTGDPWDEFMPGKVVHVMDGADGVEFEARIVSISKSDMSGRPGDVEITIANSVRDIADSINTLADRQGINELYSQGATNLYAQQYADNADAQHPARMKVYIPTGCVRINQMLLSYDVDAFRAYETGAASGGGTTVTSEGGGGTTVTSEGGGGTTVTSEYAGDTTVTSESGGDSAVTSNSGGNSTVTSNSGGMVTVTEPQKVVSTTAVTGGTISGRSGDTSGNTGGAIQSGNSKTDTGNAAPDTTSNGSHNHSWSDSTTLDVRHQHEILKAEAGSYTGGPNKNGQPTVSVSGTTGGGGSHSHTVNAHHHDMAHQHNFSHTHNCVVALDIPATALEIPGHSHSVSLPGHSHGVNIPSHSHDVDIPSHCHDVEIYDHSHDVVLEDHSHDVVLEDHSHDVVLKDHTHEIVYGIYEGDTAGSITVLVDGNRVPGTATSADELDIVQWLAKDDEGKITRGTWHTVELVPDRLTRIEANLFVQTFVQSVGGGDY